MPSNVGILVTLTLSILAPAFLWTYAETLGLPDWSYVVALAAGACSVAALTGVAMWDPEISESVVRQDLHDLMRVTELHDPTSGAS